MGIPFYVKIFIQVKLKKRSFHFNPNLKERKAAVIHQQQSHFITGIIHHHQLWR